jgi:hypothetical protein
MTFRLQDECSTTELRRPAGSEFIGSVIGGTPEAVSVKDDLLDDFPHVYPGLSRGEVQRLLTLLDQSASTEAAMGLSIATALEPLVPEVAGRIQTYNKAGDTDDYVRMLRGAAVLLLQKWQPEEQPPAPESVADLVDEVEAES